MFLSNLIESVNCRKRRGAYFSKRTRRRPTSIKMLANGGKQALAACKSLLATTLLLLFLSQASLIDRALGLTQAANFDQVEQPLDQQQAAASLLHQEILVQPNSPVRIECKLPNQVSSLQQQDSDRYYLWNFRQTATGAAKPHTLCYETKCQGARSFGFYLDAKSGSYDLINNNVSYELNDGFYYCDYSDNSPESRITREYRLTVLIPPQPPTIVASIGGAAREGQEYQLSCISSGGNPEPNITWFRNNQQLPQSGLPNMRIEQNRSNGTTTSVLSLLPSIEDHLTTYKCQVWNKAMVGLAAHEQEHKLFVEYAPRINLGPINPLRVMEGVQLTLNCAVDANPGVKSVKWFKDGQLISNQFNHTIHQAKLSDSSVYTCQAENGIPPMLSSSSGPSSNSGSSSSSSSIGSFFGSFLSNPDDKPSYAEKSIQLQVLYPPTVHVKPSKKEAVQIGEAYSLHCSVDSNPPPIDFLWTKADDPSFRKTGVASLEFPAPSASDAGNYTCTAFTRMEPSNMAPMERQASASFLMNVIHPPGAAEIVLGVNGETELGSKTQILCRAKPPGYPEPKYTFWRHTTQGQKLAMTNNKNHGPIYTINSAQPTDEAHYSCIARNDQGSSTEAEGELIVNEPPVIIADNPSRNEDQRRAGERPYLISFRAQAKPEPKVSWFHRSPVDGRRIELSSAEMQYKFRIITDSKVDTQQALRPRYNLVMELSFKQPLEVDDRGLYWVELNNGLSKTVKQEFKLHVEHTPLAAPIGLPITFTPTTSLQRFNNPKLKAGFDIGEQVSLTCRVSAWPMPEFEWSGESNDGYKPLVANQRYKMSVANVKDDIWESTLSFGPAQASDFGEYLCASANMDSQANRMSDNLNIIIKLAPKTTPDPPLLLEAVDSTQDSITLQWAPGFDGGFPQNQFLVQYALDDGSGTSISGRFPSADNQGAVVMASSGGYPGANNMLDSIDMMQQQQHQMQLSGWPKLHECLSNNPCTIGQLLPRQAYVFRVRAKNQLGSSNFGDELRAMTRANLSQIPRIADPGFDPKNNFLHFRIESGSDYLLNNLNARIEIRTASMEQMGANQLDQNVQEISAQSASGSEWRALPPVGPLRHEKVEAYLAMPADVEQLKITLCSRNNESLCGPEYVYDLKSASSSFLLDKRGISYSILFSCLTVVLVLSAFATSLQSCCLSKKAKKVVDTIDGETNIDNKPIGNGHHHHHHNKASHGGSTTSTNSTSAGGNGTSAASNGLQSMDSINGNLLGTASASDHSSDHSRQAKFDSMLPPNYNHYADRATILMEQQQLLQQQQQQQQQQQGLLADKLSSPFATNTTANNLLNSALLGQQQQQLQGSPMINNQFTYAGQYLDSQQPMSLDPTTAGNGLLDPSQQLVGWPNSQQILDDYNYNALASSGLYSAGQPPTSQVEQMIDPTYGTSAGVASNILANQYDATTGQFQSYFDPQQQDYQQRAQQYQQDMANAQQQMYGTLSRQNNGYSSNGSGNSPNDLMDNNNQSTAQNNLTNQQLMEQQYGTAGASSGLIPPPPIPIQGSSSQQESDYGTVGTARSRSRVIREIIV